MDPTHIPHSATPDKCDELAQSKQRLAQAFARMEQAIEQCLQRSEAAPIEAPQVILLTEKNAALLAERAQLETAYNDLKRVSGEVLQDLNISIEHLEKLLIA